MRVATSRRHHTVPPSGQWSDGHPATRSPGDSARLGPSLGRPVGSQKPAEASETPLTVVPEASPGRAALLWGRVTGDTGRGAAAQRNGVGGRRGAPGGAPSPVPGSRWVKAGRWWLGAWTPGKSQPVAAGGGRCCRSRGRLRGSQPPARVPAMGEARGLWSVAWASAPSSGPPAP